VRDAAVDVEREDADGQCIEQLTLGKICRQHWSTSESVNHGERPVQR
jgi:hypothetical protein